MGSTFPFDPSQNPFLADVFSHLPVLVSRLTSDGIVLQINPQVTRVTGYTAAELVGKNFWAMLFPGKLFSQVPRFISPTHPEPFLRDYPMTLRTRQGQERIVAWTRFVRQEGSGGGQRKEIVCLGQDLTDRLTDAERELAQQIKNGTAPPVNPGMAHPVEANKAKSAKANSEEADGLVLPLAISPPASGGQTLASQRVVDQTNDLLTRVETRLAELEQAFQSGQTKLIETLALELKKGTQACGLLQVSTAADRLHQAAHLGRLDAAALHLDELLKACKAK